MKNAIALTISRIRLSLRNRLFLIFSLIMPLVFLFLFLGIFARNNVHAQPFVLAQVIALTVMGNFWGLSVQLVMWREQGVLRRFRLAPVGPSAMLISSIISNYVLTLPTIAIEFYLARTVFHMTSFGNLFAVFIMATLGIVSFASLGLIIASVTNTMQETQVINQLIWFAFLFLSGATVPLTILPGFVQTAALFLPATYLVDGLQRAMGQGLNVNVMLPAITSLIGTTIIALVLSAQLFRWDPEQKATPRAKLWVVAAVIPFLILGFWEASNGKLQKNAQVNLQRIEQQSSPSQK